MTMPTEQTLSVKELHIHVLMLIRCLRKHEIDESLKRDLDKLEEKINRDRHFGGRGNGLGFMDDRTLLRIVSEASALCGYASTCRTGNSVHWMEGLAEHLNRFSNAMGWKARYKLEQGILLEEMEQLHGGDKVR